MRTAQTEIVQLQERVFDLFELIQKIKKRPAHPKFSEHEKRLIDAYTDEMIEIMEKIRDLGGLEGAGPSVLAMKGSALIPSGEATNG